MDRPRLTAVITAFVQPPLLRIPRTATWTSLPLLPTKRRAAVLNGVVHAPDWPRGVARSGDRRGTARRGGPVQVFTIERNIDRPGHELRTVPAVAAADCSFACQAENKCRAFTFVRRGAHDPFGRCFLKDGIPPAIRDNCCTSGIRKQPRRPIY
jgi:PAN domain